MLQSLIYSYIHILVISYYCYDLIQFKVFSPKRSLPFKIALTFCWYFLQGTHFKCPQDDYIINSYSYISGSIGSTKISENTFLYNSAMPNPSRASVMRLVYGFFQKWNKFILCKLFPEGVAKEALKLEFNQMSRARGVS